MATQDLTATLDLKQNLNIYATCKQLDNLNFILSIFDNSVQADLTNYNVRLKAMKSDNIPLIQELIGISIFKNIVTIDADEQLTITSGKTLIELQFINKTTGKKKATFNLVLIVAPSTLEVNATISTATYTLLEELENKLDQASDFFENITEVTEINNELKSSISIGNILKTGLDTDILEGNALKTNLENDIAAGKTLKLNLDSDISTGNLLKSSLEIDIAAAQSSQFANEIINARGTAGSLKARLDSSDASLSEKANKSEVANYNYAINGNLDVWQRGTSVVNPSAMTLLADRFLTYFSLTGTAPPTITHSKQAFSSPDVDNATNFYRINSDSAGVLNSNDSYRLMHSIENGTRKLCGSNKKVTVSFWARSSISNKKIGVYLNQHYGTGGTPSSVEVINGGYFTLTNTFKKYSITINTNTLVGKTYGSNLDDYLRVNFTFAYGSTYSQYVGDTVAETFGGSGYIDIAQIKLESGDKATPFVPRLYGEELALCQRYFVKTPYQTLVRMSFYTANGIFFDLPLHVDMRITPTLVGTANTDYAVNTITAGAPTGFTFSVAKTSGGVSIGANKTSHGLTDGLFVLTPNSGLDSEIY